jgi:hypothetical protein
MGQSSTCPKCRKICDAEFVAFFTQLLSLLFDQNFVQNLTCTWSRIFWSKPQIKLKILENDLVNQISPRMRTSSYLAYQEKLWHDHLRVLPLFQNYQTRVNTFL